MDEELVAAALKLAPNTLTGDLSSTALARAAEQFRTRQTKEYKSLNENGGEYFMAVDYMIVPEETGENGYDSNFTLRPYTKDPITDEPTVEQELADNLAKEYVYQVQKVVTEYQESTLYSPKEFVTAVADATEPKIADALGVTVGTVRGKKGRIEEKKKESRQTLAIEQKKEQQTESTDPTFPSIPSPEEQMDQIIADIDTDIPHGD